jgi:hypothetical protein
MADRPGGLAAVSAIVAEEGGDIRKLAVEQAASVQDGTGFVRISMIVRLAKPGPLVPMMEKLKQLTGVTNVSLE